MGALLAMSDEAGWLPGQIGQLWSAIRVPWEGQMDKPSEGPACAQCLCEQCLCAQRLRALPSHKQSAPLLLPGPLPPLLKGRVYLCPGGPAPATAACFVLEASGCEAELRREGHRSRAGTRGCSLLGLTRGALAELEKGEGLRGGASEYQ